MQSLLVLSRMIDQLSRWLGYVASWLVLFAVLISAGNATVRYLFHYSSNGWLEIQWYFFGAMVLLGASWTLACNEHVRVDVIYGAVSERTRLWIDTLGLTVFFLPVTAFLTIICWRYFVVSWHSGESSLNAGGLVLWPAKLLLPAGFFVLTLQGVSELIKRVAALRGIVQINTTYEKPVQ